MKTLDKLEPGDEIVIAHYNNKLEIVTVERVTKTQITAGGTRYNRRNGEEIGSGSSWHGRPHIVLDLRQQYVLSVEKGREYIARQQEEARNRQLAREIKETHWEVFNRLKVADLEAFVELINKVKQTN